MKERIFEGRLADRATTDPAGRHRLKALAKSLVGIIREGLVRDGHVRIHGFGTFRLSPTRPRVSTDPRTGRRMLRSGRHRVLFRPAKALRERIEPDSQPPRVLGEPYASREAALGGTFRDTHAAGGLPAEAATAIAEADETRSREVSREATEVVAAPMTEPLLRAHGPEPSEVPEGPEPSEVPVGPEPSEVPEQTASEGARASANDEAATDMSGETRSAPREPDTRESRPVHGAASPPASMPGHGPSISAREGEPPLRKRTAWLLLLALIVLLVLLAWLLWPAPPPPSPLTAPPGEEEAPLVTEPEPEAVEPDPVEREVAEPEAVEPEPVEPEVAEPEAVEPEPVEPEVAQPEAVEPEVAAPEVVPADEAAARAADRLTGEELAARAVDQIGQPFFQGYEHTVQRGDTLWGLADRNYVNPYYWPHIYNRNEAIDNPDRLSVDQRLMLPTLYGDPRDLTEADRRSIAEGYLRLYRFWQREGHANSHYALVGVRYFDASVMPPDLAAAGAGYPQDTMMAVFAAQLAAHFGE